jgi:hypothetical protein
MSGGSAGVIRWHRHHGRMLCLLGMSLYGCGSRADESPEVTDDGLASRSRLREAELLGEWRQLAYPALHPDSKVIDTPLGLFSLSRRVFGVDARSVGPNESYLYQSEDGLHWRLVDLPQGGTSTPDVDDDLVLNDLAFGNGQLVLVGSYAFNEGAILTSADGVEFAPLHFEGGALSSFSQVVYGESRFLAVSQNGSYGSRDGIAWEPLEFDGAFRGGGAAWGNETYVVAGGALQVSSNANDWQRVEFDCDVQAEVCVTTPDGEQGSVAQDVMFAGGRFHIRSMTSLDGFTWESYAGVPPAGEFGGYAFGRDETGWLAWNSESEPVRVQLETFPADENGQPENPGLLANARVVPSLPPPREVSFELDNGETCLTARCATLPAGLFLLER